MDDSSVRVAVRIRPQIPREIIDLCRVCTNVTPNEPQIWLGSDKAFTYDYVFDRDTEQDRVYVTCVEALIDGCFEGYNATVLAYGQTGSGKTYTMGTGFEIDTSAGQQGIIPRAVRHLFEGINHRREEARSRGEPMPDFKVHAQFLELYNEEVIDLFDNARDPDMMRGKKSGFRIHEDQTGSIYVDGVTTQQIASEQDALQCLRMGALSRTTASTAMNEQSSRSHAIFSLMVRQQRVVETEVQDPDTTVSNGEVVNEFETLTAKFHFVDLAGSERLKRTRATGERAKEGISINCGLLALGNVISALGDKSRKVSHVPYRDSKLTRLLQDSLGGNSRTVMIACISPSDRDFMETLNTLQYANRARNIKNKVMANQDKTSKTILLLRQQLQQAQLELMEFKQGKRIVSEDGVESINDMFHENTMLQVENNNLRVRNKALQETVDSLTARYTELLAWKKVADVGSGENDVTDMVQSYLKEIEDLRSKLCEAEYLCQQVWKGKTRAIHAPTSLNNSMISSEDTVQDLIEEAKRDLQREMNALRESHKDVDGETEDGDNDADGDSSSSEDEDTEDADNQMSEELANLTSEMSMKQKLIEELELSQRRMQTMRHQYEEKLLTLQNKIRSTEEERDKVLANLSGLSQHGSDDKVRRVKDDYEKKLGNLTREMKRLQALQKEHNRLIRDQNEAERKLKSYKNDLLEMKKTKVRLMNQIKEEASRRRDLEQRTTRELAQMRKESRRKETKIRNLEAENRTKDLVLKRKQEEVTSLRKTARGALSAKASGRVLPGRGKAGTSGNQFHSPKSAKLKWRQLEKRINDVSYKKQAVSNLERDMDRCVSERMDLAREKDRLLKLRNGLQDDALRDLDDQIEVVQANLDYIEDTIVDCQRNIVQLEETKESAEVSHMVQGMTFEDMNYIMEKLLAMTVHQSCLAAQKEVGLKEMENKLNQLSHSNDANQQLLNLMIVDDPTSAELQVAAANVLGRAVHSNDSSRSPSPFSSMTIDLSDTQSATGRREKARQYQNTTEDMLYSGGGNTTSPVGNGDETFFGSRPPMNRVPSAPGSLKAMASAASNTLYSLTTSALMTSSVPNSLPNNNNIMSKSTSNPTPSPTPVRRMYSSLGESGLVSPRASRRNNNFIGTRMESPPGSPTSLRRSRINTETGSSTSSSRGDVSEDVFCRLTGGTSQYYERPPSDGVIRPYGGRVSVRMPIYWLSTAEGHSKAVLSMCATDNLLFTGSKDRTVKIWDLAMGRELESLTGHTNHVVAVKYDEESRLVFSVSSSIVKVWDLRKKPTECIKILSSSGLTNTSTPVNRPTPQSLPESPLNDVAINSTGTTLYTAASDRVRIWDLRRFMSVGKLVGSHQAAVMCLAVGKTGNDDIVVTGSKDHYIKVFEVPDNSGGMISTKMDLDPPHYDGIQCLALSGNTLFSGSRDMCIKKWDLEKGELVQSLNGAHRDWVCGISIIPNQQLVVSGCRAGYLKVWSADTCMCIADIKAHNSQINAVTSNGNQVFTAASDSTVKIWGLKHSRPSGRPLENPAH